jgi:hypothetical protein
MIRLLYNRETCHPLYNELVDLKYNFDTSTERMITYKKLSEKE